MAISAFICAYDFLSILFFFRSILNWFSFEYLGYSPYLYLHCFHGFGFWVEISNNYFILYMANEASLLFGEKSKVQSMSSSPRYGKFLFGILYINFLNLKGLFGFEVEFGDSIKFGSFNSWGFWYLHLSRLILIFHLIYFCFIENFYLGSCDFLFS